MASRWNRTKRILAIESLEDRTVLAPILHAHDSDGDLFTVDVTTGETNVIGRMPAVMFDIAFAPDGQLYGVDGAANANLYVIDASDASGTLIGSVGAPINALVFSPAGTLLGAQDQLFSIDLETGTGTPFPEDLGTFSSAGDLAFDAQGRLLLSGPLSGNNAPSRLAEINQMTGAVEQEIGEIGFDGVLGLAFGSDGVLYGLSNRTEEVFAIDPVTGLGSSPVSFSDDVVGTFGGSFFEESNRIVINDVSVVEGNTGTTDAVFTLSLSASSTSEVAVDFVTTTATATADVDYQGRSGTVRFAPGETLASVSIPVVGDLQDELDETFTVDLSNPVGGTIDDAQGVGTIVDDDGPPPPVVEDLVRFGFHAQPTRLVVTFSVDIAPASVEDVSNYSVIHSGRDGVFGTPDDRTIPIASADYEAASRSVTLLSSELLSLFTTHILVISDDVISLEGNRLDGDDDGSPGGPFVRQFGREILSTNPPVENRSAGPLGDYDGDGVDDLALFEFDEAIGIGRFFVRQSSRVGRADEQLILEIGNAGAIPVAGDFDGDGITDIAVVDPNAILTPGGTVPDATVWTILLSSKDFDPADPMIVPFGAPGSLDRPAPADYDGDGITDIATLRPDSDLIPGAAEWFIRPSSDIDDGFRVQFGAANGVDLPAPADYDGDGVDDIAAYRSDSDLVPGAAQLFVLPSAPNLPRYEDRLDGFPVTIGVASGHSAPADYNGDGRVDVAVFLSAEIPTQNRSQYTVLPSRGLSPQFGDPLSVPLSVESSIAAPADYDGDGIADFADFQPESGRWTIRSSSLDVSESPRVITYGPTGSGAVPVLSPLSSRLIATGNPITLGAMSTSPLSGSSRTRGSRSTT